MNSIADPFKQLVERRLWPIALVLLAALVLVPMLLKSDDGDSAPPPVTAAVPSGAGTTEPIVSEGDDAKRDRIRAVLGARKDPFRPAQYHRLKKAKTELTDSQGATAAGSGDTGGGGTAQVGLGTDTTGAAPVAPTVTATPAPSPKTFALYSLEVRFGDTDGELKTRNVKRLTGLPGGTHPAALYLGLLDDHKSAVFIIDAGAQALGDGHCDPSPEDCQTLTLKKGETEFLTRGGKQYELDLIGIHVKKTTDAETAKTSRRTIAPEGRHNLQRLLGRIGPFDYDADKGALDRLPKAEQARREAKASRRTALLSVGR